MNVIDALVVTLGLDTKDYEKGNKDVDASLKKLREQADKTAKDMTASGKRAAEMFSSIKIELLGLLAAFGAATGVKDFIFGSIDSGAALGRLAANLHMSTQRLDAWRTAAEGVGDTAEGVATSLQNIAAGLAKGMLGDASYFQGLAKFGVNLNADMTPEQAALAISRRMQQLDHSGPQGRQLALALAQAAGTGGMAQTELRGDLGAALDRYERASGQTPQLIAQQQALQQKVAELKERLRTVSEKLFVKIEPQLEKFVNWLEKIDWDKVSNNFSKWFDDAQKILTALGGIKGVLIDIAAIKVFGWITSIGGWVLKLRSLTAALAAAKAVSAAGGGAGVVPKAAAGIGAAGLLGSVFRTLGRGVALNFGMQQDEFPDWKKKFGFMDEATDKKYTAWLASHHMQASRAAFQMFKSATPAGPSISRKPRATGRADDNVDLFGGKFGGKFGALESKNKLPAGLLQSVENAESHGNDPNYQVSSKGALGPFQFLPKTAEQFGLNGRTVFDENASATAAARYLAQLIQMFHGDIVSAVAAYNWGPGNVQRYGLNGLPLETQEYLRKVLGGMSIGAAANVHGQSPLAMNTSNSTAQVHIGQITVNTRATDAKGIAGSIRQAIADNTLIAQANSGLA